MDAWKNTTDLFNDLGILNYVNKLMDNLSDENVAKFTELYSSIYEEADNKAGLIEPIGNKTMTILMSNLSEKYYELKHGR